MDDELPIHVLQNASTSNTPPIANVGLNDSLIIFERILKYKCRKIHFWNVQHLQDLATCDQENAHQSENNDSCDSYY